MIFLGVNDPRLLMKAHAINPNVTLPPSLLALCSCTVCSRNAAIMTEEHIDQNRLAIARNLGLDPSKLFANAKVTKPTAIPSDQSKVVPRVVRPKVEKTALTADEEAERRKIFRNLGLDKNGRCK